MSTPFQPDPDLAIAMEIDGVPRPGEGNQSVTLITTFRLREQASLDSFIHFWTEIGRLMARRPGFVSANLYASTVASESREYIHVANWRQLDLMANAQSDPRIRWMEGEVDRLVISRRRVLCRACTEQLLPFTDHPHGSPAS